MTAQLSTQTDHLSTTANQPLSTPRQPAGQRIAIIGSGISGLTAAYLLSQHHQVTVFEAADRLGGHTATIDVNVQGQQWAIDTGFIVFNDWTYPNFIELLRQIGVTSQPTEMSFSVSCEQSGLEYNGNTLNTLFAQRRNLVRPRFWTMLRDILRFNRETLEALDQDRLDPDETLGHYLKRQGYSESFIQDYIVPMGAAIWSSGLTAMSEFPLRFFIRFFRNHGLLSINDRPQWRVIQGGSRAYIEPLTRRFADQIRLNTPVRRLQRHAHGVTVQTETHQHEFDQVVMACHSDQALALLADPSTEETQALSAIPYQDNEVVLHTDTRLLPKRPLAWASWNYRRRDPARMPPDQNDDALVSLTYNMNILQGLNAPETFCVTLNDSPLIDPDRMLGRFHYAHPVFTLEGLQAQAQIRAFNGQHRTWYCGAWRGNGFHEDGVVSAVEVAQALGCPLQTQGHTDQTVEIP